MIRVVGIFGMSVLLAILVASPAVAQANDGSAASAAAATIWDGVYTDAQANRGQQAVQRECAACHSASEWSSPVFLGAWSGRSVFDLYNNLRMTMPYDGPGRLTPVEYSDIVAYMLKLNSVPGGKAELPSAEEGLRKISVTRPDGR